MPRQPMPASVRWAMWSQAIFIGPLFICAAIDRHYWVNLPEGGVTNYATATPLTASMYLCAFSGCVVVLVCTGRKLACEGAPEKIYRRVYRLASLLLVDCGTAYVWHYSNTPIIYNSHTLANAALFLQELVIGGVALRRSRRLVELIAFTVQFGGAVVVLLNYLCHVPFLFLGEVLESGAFAALLMQYVRQSCKALTLS